MTGLTDEEPATVREFMKEQPMEYFVGTDPEQRTSSALGIMAIPNVMLYTPDGIVRYQGIPLVPENALTEKVIEQIIRAHKARR
jgi:cytochrome c biogenesis protein CcmG, thiol:disulfide interchange protein DsbE